MEKDALKRINADSRLRADDLRVRIETGELPRNPVLKVWELPGSPESYDRRLRPQLPAEIAERIPAHYQVVDVQENHIEIPANPVDPLYQCMLSMGADSPEEMGRRAPAASVNPIPGSSERPRFDTPHGRDGLQVSKDLEPDYPSVTDATVKKLFETQGIYDEPNIEGEPFGQEQVGSTILVDFDNPQDDPIARKFTLVGGWKYPRYTSADATGSLVSAVARRWREDPSYLIRHNYAARDGQVYAYSKGFERARQWLLDRTDESREGLVEYRLHNYGGMRNQGWRDAANSVLHADGSWANARAGVSTIDVLAVSFDGLLDAAEISLKEYGDKRMHDELLARAMSIRQFVLDKGIHNGHLVSGFDKDDNNAARQITPMTSAAGRALGSRMFSGNDPRMKELVRANIDALLSPDMFTRWGIRTMSSKEAGYVSFGYHNGSIWLHDSNEVAENFAGHGYYGLDRIVGATTTNQHLHTKRLLEHVPGDDEASINISPRNVSVYEPVEDEVFLIEQVPADTTWSGSSQYAKFRRYSGMPLHATDPDDFAYEKAKWRELPDHIQKVAWAYAPETAAALAA